MTIRKVFRLALTALPVVVLASFFITGISSRKGDPPGLIDGKLAACPDTPNCVSSDAGEIDPLKFDPETTSAEKAWDNAQEAVRSLPGATISSVDDHYLGAECTSRIFGFVDDLELQLRPEESEIAVRSASRVGHSDLGANRKRVELLRERFEAPAKIR